MQQINDTTYAIPGLGDRLISPVITLGGKDASKFAPNLNIGYDFGGGEEYYDNLNRTNKIISAKSEVKHDGKKVQLIEGSDIDEIYTDVQGRVKWDVVQGAVVRVTISAFGIKKNFTVPATATARISDI